MAPGVLEGGDGDVFDTFVSGGDARVAANGVDVAEEPVEQVQMSRDSSAR